MSGSTVGVIASCKVGVVSAAAAVGLVSILSVVVGCITGGEGLAPVNGTCAVSIGGGATDPICDALVSSPAVHAASKRRIRSKPQA